MNIDPNQIVIALIRGLKAMLALLVRVQKGEDVSK